MALASLLATVFISTVGFIVLGKHEGSIADQAFLGLWDTLNLVSTVGNLSPDMTASQRVWSMIVIVVGLGAVLYGFGIMQGLIHSGDILRYYERKKMQRTLEELSGHIVLCGYGSVGRAVAREVNKAGRKLVVIDHDKEAATHADEHGYFAIHADCTDEETLQEAGIYSASGLIATLDHDAANVYLILLAREQNPGLRIVSRADRAETRSALRRAGADQVIVPGEIAAMQLSHLMLKPKVSEFFSSATGEGEYDFTELAVQDYPGLSGKSLSDLNLPRKAEAIVITIIDEAGKQIFNPPAEHVIQPHDSLIIVGKEGALKKIEEKF